MRIFLSWHWLLVVNLPQFKLRPVSLHRLEHATHIADRLNELAVIVKTRSRASLTDGNRILESISARFFNALFGWNLVNLNIEQSNYPAADLGDRRRRIAIQVTSADGADKITHTRAKAVQHKLGTKFTRLFIFFLLPKKPGLPKKFFQPRCGPKIETWDIADLLKQLQDLEDLPALAKAAAVLAEEMGKIAAPALDRRFEISRIVKYAPAELIGRKGETKLINDVWAKVCRAEVPRPHILTFVALGGEGKTSLVANWAAELSAHDWPECDVAFVWSFYSQGTREQLAASSDQFLNEALNFFGDDVAKQLAASNAGPFEKGQRLARIVGQRRSLLILDGLEPLQYAPASPTPGQLKDQGIAALLKGLATVSRGLCIVTTRYSLPDLNAFWLTTAPEVKLLRLSRDAGVHLMKDLGVKGTAKELAALVEDMKGHALTMNLLGRFLRRAHRGDIRRRDRVKFEEADGKIDGGRAFRIVAAYEQWLLRDGGDEGRREVAVLRLMGLFDGPADASCLDALRKPPIISGLTDPFLKEREGFERLLKPPIPIPEDDGNVAVSSLAECGLVTVIEHAELLDTHPLIREYFAKELRGGNPEAWRTAHGRLFEHLCSTTLDKPQPALEDLMPLFKAVAHGCHAGRQEDAYTVLDRRICRSEEKYAVRRLGAFGSELGAMACFFDIPWRRVSPSLGEYRRAWLFCEVGLHLCALGRMAEALEPMRLGTALLIQQQNWKNAAISASNLSALELTLGQVTVAIDDARQSVTYADFSGDAFERLARRAILADALHQVGRRAEAETHFIEAERIQAAFQPDKSLLYSTQGSRFCDLLLSHPEIGAWRQFLEGANAPEIRRASCLSAQERESTLHSCETVAERVAAIQKRRTGLPTYWLLDIALDHLTMGRALLFRAILKGTTVGFSMPEIEKAVDFLRQANQQDELPRGLLTRTWMRFLTGARSGAESAQEDLNEAWEIAERGPMRLHMADIHLYRARLFFREKSYPWESPQTDLAAAEKLINDCGYHRRDEELADAKFVVK